jgi:erythronate-4-phosphate dehydrogenase
VHNTKALLNAIDNSKLSQVLLDVWENEPGINQELLKKVTLATPHIAGYGYDGKLRGTQMIFDAACQFLKTKTNWNAWQGIEAPGALNFPDIDTSDEDRLRKIIYQVYDIQKDDARLKNRPETFDNQRKTYPVRREFDRFKAEENEPLKEVLFNLGFLK